ncbi:hypothetical protein BJ878DRAFT_150018 [Calycina marina]|uniref:Nitrogen regulatory protein areA GATA-like domain-containing protein n=1 Tax=Calycina marina TaxID=1763456 RepID=A0A9P7Z010_9HELO|nr:hypothetical protein BJ878DRAFT_150018 [Calycina marina]
MPSSLGAPVLTVDVRLIHKVDTRNVENLFSMWTVFSRCAGSLEEGRRLENLSWRLWNRETFCCDPVSEANATTPAISICPRISEGHYAADVPELSKSIDSLADEGILEIESSSTSAPLAIHPQIKRWDSVHTRSRGLEKHLTSDDLQKMVINIQEKKDLDSLSVELSSHTYLSPPTDITYAPEQVAVPVEESTPATVNSISSDSASDRSAGQYGSESSATSTALSERSTTSVVRGFSPSQISSSYRSIPLPNMPSSIPSADIAAAETTTVLPVIKKPVKFVLGGVSSSADSMSDRMNSIVSQPQAAPQKKQPMFSFGGSSNEDENSLPTRYPVQSPSLRTPKKQTSFQEEVATRTIREEPFDDDVFETDDEDEVDESAIDDDDSSDWEDSLEDSNNVSIDDQSFFKRVDSKPQLTSHRSLLTVALHQSDRNLAMMSQAAQVSRSTSSLQRSPLQRSRTTSPSGPSLAASPDSDEPLTMMRALKPIPEVMRTGAQPIIMTTTNTTAHQLALSPRTTRRNMLSTELTASLRRHLLWERQQRSQTANAVLKRRHTAHDVANLKQYPQSAHMGKESAEASNASWNQNFGGIGEYHSKGW